MRLFLLLSIFASISCFSQINLYDYKLKEVKKGIYVSVRPEPLRQVVEGNFIFIVNDTDVIVVDAGGSPKAARRAIEDLKKITNKPVSFLINTHFHGDHTFGNQEYLKNFKGIEIVSSKPTAETMTGRVKNFKFFLLDEKLFNKRVQETDSIIGRLKNIDSVKYKKVIENFIRYRDLDLYELRKLYSEVKITAPTLSFDKELIITRGERQIKILHLGAGDTPGDAWVYLPGEKILITGDAIVHPVPYGFSKNPVEWIKSLEKAAALDFEIMVTGHGDVQFGKGYLLQLIELIKSMTTQIEQFSKMNKSKDEIKKMIDISDLEIKFTKSDPFLTYYFNDYFKDPITETLINYFLAMKLAN